VIQLSEYPSTNERVLACEYRERFTGLVTAAITLSKVPVRTTDDIGLEMLFKNGALLDPNGGAGGYSISGKAITLGTAAIAGDIFVVRYPYALNS
jgi:hypothetical protein